MKNPQICQSLELVAKPPTERITESRKYSGATLILVVCFISLPVILLLLSLLKNSKLRIFEPFDSSTKLLGTIGEDDTLLNPDLFIGEQNNTSTPSTDSSTNNMYVYDQQKMIDDLFASGFSEKSCISRYQYSSYHKNKIPYKPSPYLLARLRSYEELHTQCGPQSSSYRKTMKKFSSSDHTSDRETTLCKYLVWTPTNGLGNRMVSIASAFLYSLLQNRVLLVEFKSEMVGLFCEPFPNSTWILPRDFPHRSNWSELPTLENRTDDSKPSFLHLNLNYGHDNGNLQHFYCNRTLSFLEKIPALILLTDQYFIPSLFMIPSFREELNRMFPRKDTVFHHLGHYLFSPSNEAWGLITRFYQAYLAKSDQIIGLQIRNFQPQVIHTENIVSQILECTQNKSILPSFDDTTKGENLFLQNSTSKSKAVLVTSLYPEYAEQLKRMYWTRPNVNGDVISVYQPSHEEYQKFGNNKHNMKAWAEIYLLSLCDVIVTSPQSTFGYVAQSLGGLKPWIMVRLGINEHQNPPCNRGISMEPCFHFPPEYECKNKTKVNNFTEVYPHLRACDDIWWGAKLVDA